MNANEMDPITRETPFDEFLGYIVHKYLATQRFDTYLTGHKSPFKQQEIVEFFQSGLVSWDLRYSWDYQRDKAEWPDRTTEEAIRESIEHSLVHIRFETDQYMYRGKRNVFQNKSKEEMEEIKQKLIVLIEYFCEALPPNPPKDHQIYPS
jgi:hypothetical protein